MNKHVLIFILWISPIIGFSQSYTLSELIELDKKSLDDFDTYVTSKGYHFDKVKDGDSISRNDYHYENGNKTYFISRIVFKYNDNIMISWYTFKSSDYISIKSQLKTLGFVYSKSGVYKGASYLKYKKGLIELGLFSSQEHYASGESYTSYEINVCTNCK